MILHPHAREAECKEEKLVADQGARQVERTAERMLKYQGRFRVPC